jgi:DNA-binding winged helix-turn-helix (wHTH) protein/tetratricopeptide (TPR) repeat protein
MNRNVYRFRDCEVSTSRREVLLQGQQQVLEPRPFDLLIYLIEQRHRVVTKDELLAQLWQHEFVSGSVLARAVMKARQAIGDNQEPELIRTVHRKGYRFVGEVQQVSDDEAAPQPRSFMAVPALAAGVVSVALLPFDNRTGQAEFDWIELGLMSLSAKALSADARLAMVSTPSLLTALGSLSPQATLEERVSVVHRLLGVHHVVHVAISRDGERFRLDYGIDPRPPRDVGNGTLRAVEITQLGQLLARDVEAALFPEDATVAVPLGSNDRLATEAFARAMQAVGRQKWKLAVNLLQVVLDIGPDNLGAQLERAHALAHLGDDEALRMAERLLHQTAATHDNLLAAMAHDVISRFHFSRRMLEPAQCHLDEALRLAGERAPADWLQQLLVRLSAIALLRRNFVLAGQALDRLQQLSEQVGNQVLLTLMHNNRGLMAARTGHLVTAWHLAHQAADLLHHSPPTSTSIASSVNLAQISLAMGLLQAAAEYGEQALAAAKSLGFAVWAMVAGETLCRIYREMRDHQNIARVVATMETLNDDQLTVCHAHLVSARGHLAAVAQDHATAAQCLREAIAIHRRSDSMLNLHDTLPWLFASLVQAGRIDDAEALHRDMGTPPVIERTPELEAAWLHCHATDAQLRGDTETALARLTEAADIAPMGLWRALACLDAAWLHLRADHVPAARRMLRDLGPWLNQHPMGMAVDARFKYATGQFAAAHEAHQRYARTIQTEMTVDHAELAVLYSAAARKVPSSSPILAAVPLLSTVM